MKVIIDIKDSKAAFVLELLDNLKFVKTKPLSPYKAEVLEGLRDAVKELGQVRSGKKKAKAAQDLLDEL